MHEYNMNMHLGSRSWQLSQMACKQHFFRSRHLTVHILQRVPFLRFRDHSTNYHNYQGCPVNWEHRGFSARSTFSQQQSQEIVCPNADFWKIRKASRWPQKKTLGQLEDVGVPLTDSHCMSFLTSPAAKLVCVQSLLSKSHSRNCRAWHDPVNCKPGKNDVQLEETWQVEFWPSCTSDPFGSLCTKAQHKLQESRIHAETVDEFGNPELPTAHCQ